MSETGIRLVKGDEIQRELISVIMRSHILCEHFVIESGAAFYSLQVRFVALVHARLRTQHPISLLLFLSYRFITSFPPIDD